MLRHIVMIKFKDRETVSEVSQKFKELLDGMPEQIEELLAMEVGLNVNTKPSAFDLVLTADFEDDAGLDKYRVHPAHVHVLDYMKSVSEKAAVVDYYT